jgi:hypothetical protein
MHLDERFETVEEARQYLARLNNMRARQCRLEAERPVDPEIVALRHAFNDV